MPTRPSDDSALERTALKILMFEDNADDVELSLRTLDSSGFDVTADVAVTRDEFVGLVRSRSYDVVLSDFRMPGVTGAEVYEAMKAEDVDIPFILVTGSLGDEKAVECLKKGMADYVSKDRLVRLPVAVRKAIEDRRLLFEGRRSQDALRRSEASYRSLVDGAPYGIFRATIEGDRFLEVNPALVEMLGYNNAADVLMLDVRNDVWVDQDACVRILQERARGKRGWCSDVEWRRKDRSVITVELSGRMVQSGEIESCFEMVAIDVTARNLAEQRIRQLNRLYSVSSHVSQAIVRNRNAEELLREVCGIIVEEGHFRMAWVGLVDAETLQIKPVVCWGAEDGYLRAIQMSAAKGTAGLGPAGSAVKEGQHVIYQHIQTDPTSEPWGEEARRCGYASAGGFPLKFESRTVGAITLYSGESGYFDDENVALLDELAADLSFALENLGLAERRQQAVDELNQFFALSCDMLSISDMFGYVLRRNPAWEKTLGFGSGDRLPERWIDLVYLEDRPDALRALSHLQSGEEIASFELRFVTKDGSFKWLVVSATPMPDQGVVFAVMHDITERKNLDEQLRQQNLALEEQNRRIHTASRLKSEFLANMSHELRSPLNGIIGFTELLYDERVGPIAERQKDLLGRMLKSSNHLLRLINEILDLSRIESGRLDLRPERVGLDGLVREVAAILSGLAAEKRIQIETSVHPDVGEVITDPARFKQVLYNYLSNALKFTGEGGRVGISVQPEGVNEFRLEVSDTGVGISPTNLGRLFTEFQQLDSGAAKRFQGTGLGLSVTKRIVEAQGGTVGVHSTPGEGSTFQAVLPRTARCDRVPEPRILVIEDEPVQSRVIKHFLQTAGYTVETALSGSDAVAKAEQKSFDAITLDLLLPDAPGWEVLNSIRSTDQNRRTPVIVLSIIEEGRTEVLSNDAQAFLTKPVCREDLLNALERIGIVVNASKV